ncbi:unnamed protein product [Symbiodinium natans]|uniref:Uncharacterized protein n=1 Tax=Symbiodinium natans TaxID=878477 RepID=A0A812JDG9_9DINO|nr:unnamed protein product [Symbiodinium natans]
MTIYRAWGSALCQELDEQDRRDEAANDQALGLAAGPKGLPTAKAAREIQELKGHSKQRAEFIAWSRKRCTLQVDECEEAVAVKFAERDHVGKALGGHGLWHRAREPRQKKVSPIEQWVQLINRNLGQLRVANRRGKRPRNTAWLATRCSALQTSAKLLHSTRLHSSLHPSLELLGRKCWLKMGDPEKALADAESCTQVEPMNPKGWFRKSIRLHALQRYADAIPALLEAEKSEPSNAQVWDAIKMAQLMARKAVKAVFSVHVAGGNSVGSAGQNALVPKSLVGMGSLPAASLRVESEQDALRQMQAAEEAARAQRQQRLRLDQLP